MGDYYFYYVVSSMKRKTQYLESDCGRPTGGVPEERLVQFIDLARPP
jgi:hypothetical protein